MLLLAAIFATAHANNNNNLENDVEENHRRLQTTVSPSNNHHEVMHGRSLCIYYCVCISHTLAKLCVCVAFPCLCSGTSTRWRMERVALQQHTMPCL